MLQLRIGLILLVCLLQQVANPPQSQILEGSGQESCQPALNRMQIPVDSTFKRPQGRQSFTGGKILFFSGLRPPP